ncbi:Poly [ADP-ribose] polymerase 3 [Aphanomyces cochlioides]|nr:Poly [ADP-ribose] polymerase 3 [Aphanomyces cochlioides]
MAKRVTRSSAEAAESEKLTISVDSNSGKRKATSSKQKVGKKSKKDTSKTVEKAITPPVDGIYAKNVPESANHAVYRDYDVMLNQVHISSYTSNNKFYRIQLIKTNPATYNVFSRWGRVGEDGDYKLWCPGADLKTAMEVFHKKFNDKTRNNWKERRNFEHRIPKIGDDSVPSELPPKRQKLIEMIFDKDMFKDELVRMNLDPKRMPLGALSLKQIQKGVAILDNIQATLAEANPSIFTLEDLSAKFYQFDIWEVRRSDEDKTFSKFDATPNHRLLWRIQIPTKID